MEVDSLNPNDSLREELLFIVTPDDVPIIDQRLTRSEVHADLKYWHRVTSVFIRDAEGRILCHQRSLHRSRAPGLWNHNFGGHVAFQEDTVYGALRELEEEISLRVERESLQFITKYFASDVKHVDYIYVTNVDPSQLKLTLNIDEVAAIRWMTVNEIIENENLFVFPLYPVFRPS